MTFDLDALEILLEVRGVSLGVKPDGGLKVSAPSPLEPELLEIIKAHKLALLEKLTTQPTPPSPKVSHLWLAIIADMAGLYEEFNARITAKKQMQVFAEWVNPDLSINRTLGHHLRTKADLESFCEGMSQSTPCNALYAALRVRYDPSDDKLYLLSGCGLENLPSASNVCTDNANEATA